MRLGLRLLVGYLLVVGLAAYFVLRVFVAEGKPAVRQAIESTLVDEANLLAEVAAEDLAGGTLASGALVRALAAVATRKLDAQVWRHRKTSLALRVTVTDARGVVVYDSAGLEVGADHSRWNDVRRTLRGQYGARSSPERPGDPRLTVMHVAAPIYAPGPPGAARQLIGVLTVAQPNRVLEPFIAESERNIVRRGAWLIAACVLIALVMTWWLSARIGRLRRYSMAVAAGQRAAPPPSSRDELGDLGRAMEAMRQKLEGKAYVERYVHALTHELKSPLAAIRGAAELLADPLPEHDRRRFAEHIAAQERRMTETIDKLLVLAAVEQRGWLDEVEVVEIDPLVARALEDASAKARAGGVELRSRIEGEIAALRGDPYMLRQALANLIDNAIAFSAAGAAVEVTARGAGRHVELCVTDSGPGVPEYAKERVFDRFYSLPRPDGTSKSSGLGLPFVREVARLHGGDITLTAGPGGGTVACLRLPFSHAVEKPPAAPDT